MKHLKSFNENLKLDIDSICNKYGIKNYTINQDGTIDVDGHVNLGFNNLTKLPLKFNIVSRHFDCSNNKLTSLEGCPKEVGGFFDCRCNQLTTLEGCPKEVGGTFDCHNNQLMSLKGSPKEIGNNFYCHYNQLTTLEGGPTKIGGIVYCYSNPLPDVILNSKYLKNILLEGDDFYIWKNGKLDMSSFNYMLDVFKDEDIS